MDIISEYLNKIQDSALDDSSLQDTESLCQPGQKWNPQLQRCVKLGDGENIDFSIDQGCC